MKTPIKFEATFYLGGAFQSVTLEATSKAEAKRKIASAGGKKIRVDKSTSAR